MKFSILVLILACINTSFAQVNWKETTDWKIYNPEKLNIFSVPVDSLIYMRSRVLEPDSIHQFLDTVQALPHNVRPAWMGGFLASYVFHGALRKIEVSSYGGFFYDQQSRTYFQLAAESKDRWLTYLNNNLLLIE